MAALQQYQQTVSPIAFGLPSTMGSVQQPRANPVTMAAGGALTGASFLGLKNAINQPLEINYLIIVSIVLSFLFSYITVKFFLNYINKFSLNIFVFYRIFIAAILFLILYF